MTRSILFSLESKLFSIQMGDTHTELNRICTFQMRYQKKTNTHNTIDDLNLMIILSALILLAKPLHSGAMKATIYFYI